MRAQTTARLNAIMSQAEQRLDEAVERGNWLEIRSAAQLLDQMYFMLHEMITLFESFLRRLGRLT
jgi:hypothetical protein